MLQCGFDRTNFAFDIAAASYSVKRMTIPFKTLERVMGIEPT
jgi:hypothetical protein